MPTHSFSNLMRRLSAAGFKRDVVRTALLPDWWDDSLAHEGSILPEVEIRVARFLNRPIAEVRDPAVSLRAPGTRRVGGGPTCENCLFIGSRAWLLEKH